MTGFYGADVAELRALAQQFSRAADALTSTGTQVGAAVVVAQRWEGPDSDAFRDVWQTSGRAAVNDAASALREASARLLGNAAEQQEASAADGGGLSGLLPRPGFPGGGGGGGGWGDFGPRLTPEWPRLPDLPFLPVPPLPFPIDGFMWPHVQLPGFDFDAPPGFLDTLPYRIGPGGFHHDFERIGDWLDTETPILGMDIGHFVEKLPGLDGLGELNGILEIVSDPTTNVGDKLLDLGYIAAQDLGETIRANAKGPVGYLAGLNVSIWSDVVNEARNVDWSPQALTDAFTYAAEDPTRLVEPIVEGVVGTLDKVTGYVGVGWVGDLVTDAAANADFSPETLATVGSYIADNPDVVLEEVGNAIGTVAKDFAEAAVTEGARQLVDDAIDFVKFW